MDIYISRLVNRAKHIIKGSSYLGFELFDLLPQGGAKGAAEQSKTTTKKQTQTFFPKSHNRELTHALISQVNCPDPHTSFYPLTVHCLFKYLISYIIFVCVYVAPWEELLLISMYMGIVTTKGIHSFIMDASATA